MRGCFLLYSTQFLLWPSVHPYHTIRAWGQIQDCCCKTEPFVLPCLLRKTVPLSLRQIVILPRHQSLKIWAPERGRATFVFSEKVKQHAAEGWFIGNFYSEWNQLRKSSPGLQGRGQHRAVLPTGLNLVQKRDMEWGEPQKQQMCALCLSITASHLFWGFYQALNTLRHIFQLQQQEGPH